MIPPDRRTNFQPYLLPLIAFPLVALVQMWMPSNHDHAWQFYLARQVLDGARLYLDVGAAEMHPPLITWVSMLMESIGRVLGVSGIDVYVAFVLLTAAASLYASWRLGARSPMLMVVLILAVVVWPGYQFAQGDHLAVLWSLPYLTAATRYVDGQRLSPRAALAVGIAAGLGMSMKPHFALLWIATELYVAYNVRWQTLWRTESISILSVFIVYVLATALITPQFFQMTWIPELYVKFGRAPYTHFIINSAVLLLVIASLAVWRLPTPPELQRLSHVFLLAAVTLFAAAVLQFKGWRHHWIPSEMMAIAAIGAALPWRSWLVPGAIALLSVALTAGNVRSARQELVGEPYFQGSIIPLLEHYGKDGSYLVLAEGPFAAFPLVTDRHVRWASPYMHLWQVPALYPDFWRGKPLQYHPLEQRGKVERDMFDQIWRHVERDQPAVILLQKVVSFDFAAYFSSDPRFAALFRHYLEAPPIGPYRVAVRSDVVQRVGPMQSPSGTGAPTY
jgi:hypothetical protein